MPEPKQSKGRQANGAIPGDKPDATTSSEAVREVGLLSRRKAGPDGPSAAEVGDTFKRRP